MELMESCVRCHGDEESLPISDRVPRLHGQSEAYLIRALENYGDGTRESGIMKPIAYEMSSEETAALASYYASLSLSDAEPLEDPAAVARGRQIAKEGVAEGGIPPCSSCHRGDNPQFPKLAGQSAAYLRGQLELWGKGLRDRSGYGAIMAVVAKRLTPAQIRDVTAFYASQPSALSAESRASAP
jgi:cytochrome c553